MNDNETYLFAKELDVNNMLAAQAFWNKYGRPPTQEEWEQYWYNGCRFEGFLEVTHAVRD